MRRFLILSLTLILCLGIFSAANAEKYKVNTVDEPLNVRAEPRGEVIGIVRQGKTVEVVSLTKEWAEIVYDGSTAYVYRQYIVPVDANEQVSTKKSGSKTGIPVVDGVPRYLPYDGELFQVSVDKGSLNVRKEPSTQNDIIVRVKNGGYVEVLSIKNGWAKVNYGAGKKGYVSTEFLVPVAVDYD